MIQNPTFYPALPHSVLQDMLPESLNLQVAIII